MNWNEIAFKENVFVPRHYSILLVKIWSVVALRYRTSFDWPIDQSMIVARNLTTISLEETNVDAWKHF